MSVNLGDIYKSICGYEAMVEHTVEVVSSRAVGTEILSMVSTALTNIEKLTPRSSAWHASTPEKSSKIIV